MIRVLKVNLNSRDPTGHRLQTVIAPKNAVRPAERKADWVMSFYKGYKTIDGIENWPEMEVDFARMQLGGKMQKLLRDD